MVNLSPLLLLFTVVGIIGLVFVTVPSLEYMLGLANGNTNTSWFQVVGTIFILWISTGIFVAMTLGGVTATITAWD